MLIVLVGKSCSGKDTIKKEVIKLGINPVTTYTTRPMRYGEVNGKTYHFVDDAVFDCKLNRGEFLECTSYCVANGQIWRYATPCSELDGDKIVILNPDGLKAVKSKNIDCITFYVDVSDETLNNRLQLRGDNPEEAKRRAFADKRDFNGIEKYVNFTIRNENSMTPEIAANIIFEVYKIIRKEKKDEN